MGKFKIHPFRQEKAILNENGQILKKGRILKQAILPKSVRLQKKGLLIIFHLSESSHDFSFLSWFVFSA